MKFILQILFNAGAIFIANRFIPGFEFSGDIIRLLVAGLAMGVINLFLRPILKLLTFPLAILASSLVSLAINAALLYIGTLVIPGLVIMGWIAYLGGAFLFAVINFIFHL
ncbi:MAG: phage holin family protein [Parcubacteria group bacterium]|nr:phage holin family protein [Parcubacteria group bacterium]